jgi:hypothetical protein
VKTHLYRHFNAEGELLYVGISLSAINRLGQHKDNSHWFDSICRVDIQNFDTREEAVNAETLAIRDEKPKHNVRKQIDLKKEKYLNHKHINTIAKATQDDLTSNIIQFNLIYSYSEAAKLLRINSTAVKKLIEEKKLGSITLPPNREGLSGHGTPFKPKEVVSGWQLISYFETLHKGVF